MKKAEIIEQVRESPHSKVKVAVTDIDGILRGKLMHRDKFLSAIESEFGFCDVVFGWDMADELYDNSKVTGWHTGYGDASARIDLDTFRQVPWEGDIAFFLADFSSAKKDDFPVCPRSLLKKIIKKTEASGFFPMFSQEFEWFNFVDKPKNPDSQFSQPEPLTSGMFGYSILRASENSNYFNDLFDLLEEFRVPLEGLHTETGPGVYEAAIQYSSVLEAADRGTLFKTAVKEIAKQHGIVASFMAKPFQNLPGCSGHIHQSLWDQKKEKNLFFDASNKKNMSDTMESYIAGQLHCLPHILPMLAPTVNSYKRLVKGAWAPTTLTWGIDNRTTALRAITTGEKSTRLETRVVGSDVNPFLAMSACLASGLYGIKNKLALNTSMTIGNGYEETKHGELPTSLDEATRKMITSPLAIELFGEAFVDHFGKTRDWEWRQFSRTVTDWEMKRYFEII
ncbi:MAG: glutamine synthetase [Reichenbachiella sp.]